MAWGARQEDGVWRLCERKGGTIVNLNSKIWPGVEVKFAGRAACERCAHALNDLYWDAYSRHKKKTFDTEPPFQWAMIELIREHGGLTAEDWKRIIQ